MNQIEEKSSLGSIVADNPKRADVLERWGIDYCCGGSETIGEACTNVGANLPNLLLELGACDIEIVDPDIPSINQLTGTELIENIISTHHKYLEDILPRIENLIIKVCAAHSANHPELLDLKTTFIQFKNELESHMLDEEQNVFPMIAAILQEPKSMVASDKVNFMEIFKQLTSLEEEHRAAGAALGTFRRLTNAYTPPEDACASYKKLLITLAELETDMHKHVHKENSILFPKALNHLSKMSLTTK